jgi:hypothetical protein
MVRQHVNITVGRPGIWGKCLVFAKTKLDKANAIDDR